MINVVKGLVHNSYEGECLVALERVGFLRSDNQAKSSRENRIVPSRDREEKCYTEKKQHVQKNRGRKE